MWRSFFTDRKWFYWSYGGGIFILFLLVSQTYLDVLFNSWYKDFYDILQTAEKRDISEFWESIEKFLYIALPYVTLFAFTNWFTRLLVFSGAGSLGHSLCRGRFHSAIGLFVIRQRTSVAQSSAVRNMI